jgi:predicted transporter
MSTQIKKKKEQGELQLGVACSYLPNPLLASCILIVSGVYLLQKYSMHRNNVSETTLQRHNAEPEGFP